MKKTLEEMKAEKTAAYDARPTQSEDPSLATAVREFIAWVDWAHTLHPYAPASDSGSGFVEELCGEIDKQVERLKSALRDPNFYITVGGRLLLDGEKLALSPRNRSTASPWLSRAEATEVGVKLFPVYDDAQHAADALVTKVPEEVIVWRSDGERMGTSPRGKRV